MRRNILDFSSSLPSRTLRTGQGPHVCPAFLTRALPSELIDTRESRKHRGKEE